MKPFIICEFGEIRNCKDYNIEPGSDESYNKLYLKDRDFLSLERFVLENQSPDEGKEPPFSLHIKNRKKYIKVKNYVGVLETRDGIVIEILPKIFSSVLMSIPNVKKLFLRMLRCLKDSPFKRLGLANLHTSSNFPILEVFIAEYIRECEELMIKGLRADYVTEEDNLTAVKGRICFTRNMWINLFNKARFYCSYSDHNYDTAQNRIIRSALVKLSGISRSKRNKTALQNLIYATDAIPESKQISVDLDKCKHTNRLHAGYSNILRASETFLLGASFTSFHGNTMNAALLFPMERIFEGYIAHLFKRYRTGYTVTTQEKRYFLIDKHKDGTMFGLKPDIILDNESGNQPGANPSSESNTTASPVLTRRIIIDTKWKLLNQNKTGKNNYNIKQSDIYQMYAYGKKCYNREIIPKPFYPELVLIYPVSDNFDAELPVFEYEEGSLKLLVIPFDLSSDPEKQIQGVISKFTTDEQLT